MPSQTTSSVSRPALFRQTLTESSFSSRSRPGSVAQAIRNRISCERRSPSCRSLDPDQREVDCVLADRQAVTVVELLFLDGLAVDQGAVGAPEVDDPELVSAPLDACVVAARRGVAQDDVVVG